MGTNFYKQASINQNLTFDKIYPNKKTLIEQANKDGIFPKRLVIINYYNENGYIENANIDKKAFQGVTYDSTVWQKQNDGTYLQIADLDSMTIEIDPTLTFPDNEKCVLVGVGSEQEGKPVILDKNSFLDLVESNDKKNFVLKHEANFNAATIPTSTGSKLNFRDFKIEKSHTTGFKELSLQAEDDIVLTSTDYKNYKISHKNSTIGTAHTFNASFDATNKKIYIDKPTFDIHGHLEDEGSNAFNFSIVGDEDIISSNYKDNIITLSHNEAVFNSGSVLPTWSSANKGINIPQLTFDKWGHVNLNADSYLLIKFDSDRTYIENENLTYGIKFNHKTYTAGEKNASVKSAIASGAIDFLIPNVSRDTGGHVDDLSGFSYSIEVDKTILLLSDVTDDGVMIKHKDDYNIHSFTNNKSTVISDGEDEPEDVLTFSIPRFEINKFGHVEKVSGSSVWENDPYIYSDGVIYFDIHPTAEEGRICHRDRLTLLANNNLIQDTDYELYNPIEKIGTAFGDRARFYIRVPIFDNKGHIIKNQGNLTSHCIYCDFMGDENIIVSSAQSDSTDGAKIQSAIFTHKEYNHTELEDLYNIKTVSPAYSETMENIQPYDQYYDSSISGNEIYKFKFYKKIVWNISMLPGSNYYYKIYYLNDVSKTDLSGAAIIESEMTGTPGWQIQHITGIFEEKMYPEQELVLEISPKTDVFFYPTTAVQGYTNNNFTQLSISNFLFNNAGHYRDKNYYEDIELTEEIKLEYETQVQEIIDTAEKLTAQVYLDILAKVKYPLFYVNEETGRLANVAQDPKLSNLPNMIKTSKEQLKINWLEGQYKIRKSNENTVLILNPNNFQINQEKDSNHITIDLSNSLLNRINQLEARIAELENK